MLNFFSRIALPLCLSISAFANPNQLTPQTPTASYHREPETTTDKKLCKKYGKRLALSLAVGTILIGGGYYYTILCTPKSELDEETCSDHELYGGIAVWVGAAVALGGIATSTCSYCMDCCGCSGQDAVSAAGTVNDVAGAVEHVMSNIL